MINLREREGLDPLPTSARTSTSCRVFRKEEASPFAGGQFARNGLPGKVNEILGCLENVNDTDAFFTGDDCDPGAIGTESRACRCRSTSLPPAPARTAIWRPDCVAQSRTVRSSDDAVTTYRPLGLNWALFTAPPCPLRTALSRSARDAPDPDGAIA